MGKEYSVHFRRDLDTMTQSFCVVARDGERLFSLTLDGKPLAFEKKKDAQKIAEQMNIKTTNELLEVVIDRLEGFQSGPFACESNAAALQHCELALHELFEWTKERVERGVEGKHKA